LLGQVVVSPKGFGDLTHGGHGQAQAVFADDAKACHAGQLAGARLRVQQGQGRGQTVGQGRQIDGAAKHGGGMNGGRQTRFAGIFPCDGLIL